ncbi:MAG: lipopolysaccharide assembly protein LapB [Gammaproteobacteria bacterium]|nr:lipopolysaccharide assembly protein LapB [Gammaproteobacteria bacterium]
MLDLLWLLLPVAAAGGWFAARRGSAESRSDAFWDHASNYHRGLNFLLNEQQDKAVELFVNMTDVDKETAETHLALGNMFRRRGEVDRAIRVHQSLIDKGDLGNEIRADALYELARDFDTAGLLDRSEKLFKQMIEQGHNVPQAYTNLLSIYERERDWPRAIAIATEYGSQIDQPLEPLIAHYYCELAQLAINENKYELAASHLDNALRYCDECARANVMWGELALRNQDYATAIERFEQVEKQRPELMPEIISPLFEALVASENEQALRAYIDRIRGRLNAYSVTKMTRGMIEKLDGQKEADEFFKDQIVKRPSLKGLRDWARGQLQKSPPAEREKVEAMCDMLDQVVRDKPSYQCTDCGFRGQSLHWRCPSCGHWDTVHTIIGAEGE